MRIVAGVSDALDDGVETIVFVGFVGYNSLGAVWFDEGVFSLDFVAITGFPLVLNVVVFQVMDSIVEVVDWMSLIKKNTYIISDIDL